MSMTDYGWKLTNEALVRGVRVREFKHAATQLSLVLGDIAGPLVKGTY